MISSLTPFAGIHVEDVKKCLGYHLDTSLVSKDLDYQLKIKGGKCENITITSTCKYIFILYLPQAEKSFP